MMSQQRMPSTLPAAVELGLVHRTAEFEAEAGGVLVPGREPAALRTVADGTHALENGVGRSGDGGRDQRGQRRQYGFVESRMHFYFPPGKIPAMAICEAGLVNEYVHTTNERPSDI